MTEVTETGTVEAPQLGIGDLAGAIQIIDVCSRRGAFEGSELENVGALRARLAAFVQANSPAPEEATEETTTEEGETE